MIDHRSLWTGSSAGENDKRTGRGGKNGHVGAGGKRLGQFSRRGQFFLFSFSQAAELIQRLDRRSNVFSLSSWEKQAWKKFKLLTDIWYLLTIWKYYRAYRYGE